jgi:hypothetical protein
VLLDADRFADRATTTLRDPSVRALIADRVTDELVLDRAPDLIAARPLISPTVSDLVGGGTRSRPCSGGPWSTCTARSSAPMRTRRR